MTPLTPDAAEGRRDIVHICTFSDPCDYRITDGKRVWFFDWSEQFGPSLTNGRGTILSNPCPSEKSRFWRCVELWRAQGKRSEPDVSNSLRNAVWDEPPVGTYVLDERSVIIRHDEPAGFHDRYSAKRFVDAAGNPTSPLRARRRMARANPRDRAAALEGRER